MLSSGVVFDAKHNVNNVLVCNFHIRRIFVSDLCLFLLLLVSCQTTLTLPTGFDIFQVLGKYTSSCIHTMVTNAGTSIDGTTV